MTKLLFSMTSLMHCLLNLCLTQLSEVRFYNVNFVLISILQRKYLLLWAEAPKWLSAFQTSPNDWSGACLKMDDPFNSELREKIKQHSMSVIDFRNYLFARQAALLLTSSKPGEVWLFIQLLFQSFQSMILIFCNFERLHAVVFLTFKALCMRLNCWMSPLLMVPFLLGFYLTVYKSCRHVRLLSQRHQLLPLTRPSSLSLFSIMWLKTSFTSSAENVVSFPVPLLAVLSSTALLLFLQV